MLTRLSRSVNHLRVSANLFCLRVLVKFPASDRSRQRLTSIIPIGPTSIIPLGPPVPEGQSVYGASDPPPAAVQNVGVNHGRTDIGVSEQLLNRADIVAIFQQMGGKGMAHGVRAGWLRDAGLEPCIFDGLLENRLVEVVPPPLSRHSVGVVARGGEDPLPTPFLSSIGILAFQGIWQAHPSPSSPQVLLVPALDLPEMLKQGFLDCGGEHRDPVLFPFAVSDHDLVLGEVGVLDPQAAAVHEPQSCPVEQYRHQWRSPVHPSQESAHLFLREHYREPPRPFGPDDAVYVPDALV